MISAIFLKDRLRWPPLVGESDMTYLLIFGGQVADMECSDFPGTSFGLAPSGLTLTKAMIGLSLASCVEVAKWRGQDVHGLVRAWARAAVLDGAACLEARLDDCHRALAAALGIQSLGGGW